MLNLRKETLGSISRVAGQAKAPVVEIRRGVKTHRLGFEVALSVTIAGSSGGTVNSEGLLRCIESIRLLENGSPTVDISGRMLGFLTGRAQRQAASIGALSAATAATYTIAASLVLDFASVFSAVPSESAYVERDARFPTQIEVTFASDIQGALISGTGLTVNSLTITPWQEFDPNSTKMPFFLPRIKRASSAAITATVTRFPILLYPEGENRVEAHIFHGLVDGVTNANIFNGNVTYRGDKTRYIDALPYLALLNAQRIERNFPAASAAYMEINNRRYGQLSEAYYAGQDNNLRLEADVTLPSGSAATFDVYSLELEPIPGYTSALPQGW